MIKDWISFNENKSEKPGPNIDGSSKMDLTEEDISLFSDEQSIEKLVMDNKVSLIGHEVWYWTDDLDTRSTLEFYIG